MELTTVNAARGITTREQFQKNLVILKQIANAGINSPEEGKGAMTKADALRAWAAFDKRVTDEEKKEANRAQTRIMAEIGELAEREQPASSGPKPGPTTYLIREFQMSNVMARQIRALNTRKDAYTAVLESGRPWTWVYNGAGCRRSTSPTLTKALLCLRAAAPKKSALGIPIPMRRKSIIMARDAIGWLQTYVETLETLIAREKAGFKTPPQLDQQIGA